MDDNDKRAPQDGATPSDANPAETAAAAATASEQAAADAAAPSEAARVAELEAEVARLKDQALRALAEAENTRRRAQRDIEENSKYAITGFARDILPVADNLRRAIDSVPAEARQADERLDKFVAGVELTERELLATLERHGIQRFDPTGQPFDHNFHQAMMQVDSPTHAAGTVVQVFQAGYTIHGRLLRPAMVTVAKGNAAEATGARVDTSA
ncbi:MAG TPA: nucleotide exchange factor GrpE [Alphaproteobacteria bacterium]